MKKGVRATQKSWFPEEKSYIGPPKIMIYWAKVMQKVFRTTQTCDLLRESRTVNHQKSLFSGQRKKSPTVKSRICLKLKNK